MSFNPFNRIAEAFLYHEECKLKSAKDRFYTDGEHFYSYDMPIAWHQADKVVEVLHDTRAPTLTTAKHIGNLRGELAVISDGDLTIETVFDLGAPVCDRCGHRHGSGPYPEIEKRSSEWFPGGRGRRPRKVFTDAETVCEVQLAIQAAEAEAAAIAERVEAMGLIGTNARCHAAVRDAGLPYERGPAWVNGHATNLKDVVSTNLWVEPLVARIIEIDIPHKTRRKLLVRFGKDSEFRDAVEALAVTPNLLQAFALNYAEEQLG
jgi:hypothetical protein